MEKKWHRPGRSARFGLLSKLIPVLWLTAGTVSAQQYVDVTRFGARRDSSQLATTAIRKAIEAAAKAGGGTVYFPPGLYKTGPIHLKSHITLLIDAGAEIHFSDDFNQYLPMVPSRWEGTDVVNFSPLIYADHAENIAIQGRGLLHGHGRKWWHYSEVIVKNSPGSKWQDEFHRLNKDVLHPDLPGWVERGFLRPPFIQFMHCKNVQIEGVTITNSPFWTVNPEYCDNVTVSGVTIDNPKSPNTDGINPESCKNVHISNCHISVGDDCITIKSGKDRSGRKSNVPAENHTITNCTMLSGHGGVVIGSEMSGGVRNIVISNCIFDGTDRGIRIKTARGRGGVVEDIRVDNVIMRNIREQAVVLDMQYAKTNPEPVSGRTPAFRRIHLSNISASGKQAGYVNGLEEMPVEDISFTGLRFRTETGFVLGNARQVVFRDVTLTTTQGPALTANRVSGLEINGLRTEKAVAGVPVIDLKNVTEALVSGLFLPALADVFLRVSGSESAGIVVTGNLLKKAVTQREQEVPADAIAQLP